MFTLITKVHADCFAGGEFKTIARDPILYTVYTQRGVHERVGHACVCVYSENVHNACVSGRKRERASTAQLLRTLL